MKLFKLSLLLLTIGLLSSCGDDELLSETIVGSWNLESVVSTGCDNPDNIIPFMETDDNNCVSFGGGTFCDVTLVFNADGTASQSITQDGATEVLPFTFTVNDDNDSGMFCDEGGLCRDLTVDGDNVMTQVLTQEDNCVVTLVYSQS